MKVTIRSLTNLNKDLKTVLMGGEKEEIFFIDFSTDNKVKKGELHLHPSIWEVESFSTTEQDAEIYITRRYKRMGNGYEDFSLAGESIVVEDNIRIKESFIREAS
tara:strand:- start:915 stop:1229 length:315 start_codon:yes stop_codon:yes gene_type:complete